MKIAVSLPKKTVQTLCLFGNLNDVVNKILYQGEIGVIDIMNKPKTNARKGQTTIVFIDITNEYYLDLLKTFTSRSSTISLHRLLVWFTENEIYNTLDFEIVNEPKEVFSTNNVFLKRYSSAVVSLQALYNICNENNKNLLKKVFLIMKSMGGSNDK